MGCILQVELAGRAPFAFWPSPLIAFGSKQCTIGCRWECNLEKDWRRETEMDPVGRERYIIQTQRNWNMWDFLRTFGNQTYFVGRPDPHSWPWISRSFILGSHLLCQPFKRLLCPLLWLFQPLHAFCFPSSSLPLLQTAGAPVLNFFWTWVQTNSRGSFWTLPGDMATVSTLNNSLETLFYLLLILSPFYILGN